VARRAERVPAPVRFFGAWEIETGCYVGEVYLANPDWEVPTLELGYFLTRSKTGMGFFATELAQRMIAFAFGDLQVARLDLQVAADNLPSVAVAERCGFVLEGRQRKRHRRGNGDLVDRLWHGLSQAEWIGTEASGQRPTGTSTTTGPNLV